MTLYKWSQIAANNATADSLVNWQEGQAPSSVNDSARQMMAAVAKYRDDVSGAIVTSGTSTAYTVSSFETFDTLARLSGQTIAFTPHVTNGATVTLSVDALGARPLRSFVGVDLLAGVLIQGTPYVAVYNSSDSAFYLQGFYGNPYNVPLAAGMDYWGPTTPNSAFAFPTGQAVSRTTYAALFAIMGTTHGVGDGSTTFNLPDKTGRVSAMKETVADGSRNLSTSYFGDSTTLGAKGGSQSHALTTAQLATHSHANTATVNDPTHQHSSIGYDGGATNAGGGFGGQNSGLSNLTSLAATGITVTINNANAGSGSAHNNVQPTIICNYIIRVI